MKNDNIMAALVGVIALLTFNTCSSGGFLFSDKRLNALEAEVQKLREFRASSEVRLDYAERRAKEEHDEQFKERLERIGK